MSDEKTATLQVRRRMTVKEQAASLELSERNIYKARLVHRTRPDLGAKVIAGEISVHRAWLEATGRAPPSTRDKLWSAWLAATDEDKAELVAMIWELIEADNAETG